MKDKNVMLENTELLIQKNTKKKNPKGRGKGLFWGTMFIYELSMRTEEIKDVSIDKENADAKENISVSLFTLETLADVISVTNEHIRKGTKFPIVFYSRRYILPSDNLTVSLLEYAIYYFYKEKNIEIYITQGILSKDSFDYCIHEEKRFHHNGFFCGTASSGFLMTSFLLSWSITNKKNQDASLIDKAISYRDDKLRRYKTLIGKGPWDASIAVSECQDFLSHQKVIPAGIKAVMDVIGELAPNAIEHGDTNCIVDLSCEDCEFPDEDGNYTRKGLNVSLVIWDFSEKLLGTDLNKKIFIDSMEQDFKYKAERISTIRQAWDHHKNYLTDEYNADDFHNVMAFQKISGRAGDRPDGGLGISTLIERVQQYTKENYCYVLSGYGALRLDQEFTGSDAEGYIGFNELKDFKGHIPDKDAVLKTKFYLPGVAYNLCFNFLEE